MLLEVRWDNKTTKQYQ